MADHTVDFAHVVAGLKALDRTGWVRSGVVKPESVADHSWRTALLALLLGGCEGLDRDRLIRMCLVHDLAEVKIGDITPFCGVDSDEKRRREEAAILQLAATLQSPEGEELTRLWRQFETGDQKEARFARELDKLEMILQADTYEQMRECACVPNTPNVVACSSNNAAGHRGSSSRSDRIGPFVILHDDRRNFHVCHNTSDRQRDPFTACCAAKGFVENHARLAWEEAHTDFRLSVEVAGIGYRTPASRARRTRLHIRQTRIALRAKHIHATK